MCPEGKLQLFHVRGFGVQPCPVPCAGTLCPRVSSHCASQVGHCYSSEVPALEVGSEHLLQLRQAAYTFRPVLLDANTLWKGETVDEASDTGTIYIGSSI